MAIVLKHQTQNEFIQRIRTAYRESNKEILASIARFILNKIQSGDLTDNQCRNAFGLTATQWAALKTKMQNLVNASDAVNNSTGE